MSWAARQSASRCGSSQRPVRGTGNRRRGARGLHVKLLQNLNGEPGVRAAEKLEGGGLFLLLRRLRANGVKQDVRVRRRRRRSQFALMKSVARQPVSRRETLDLSAQRLFLPVQPLELRFCRRELSQIFAYHRRDRGFQLGCTDARPSVGFIVQCNCDIFHISQLHSRQRRVNRQVFAPRVKAAKTATFEPRRCARASSRHQCAPRTGRRRESCKKRQKIRKRRRAENRAIRRSPRLHRPRQGLTGNERSIKPEVPGQTSSRGGKAAVAIQGRERRAVCLLSCFGADAPHNDVQAPCLAFHGAVACKEAITWRAQRWRIFS